MILVDKTNNSELVEWISEREINEKGNEIDFDLISDVKSVFDGDEKGVVICDDVLEITKLFSDYCEEKRSEGCCMFFTNNFEFVKESFSRDNLFLGKFERKEDLIYSKEKGVVHISYDQIISNIHETSDAIMEFSSGKDLAVFVDFDLVGEDLSYRQMVFLIHRISRIRRLKTICFMNCEKDIELSAKVISEVF